MSEPIVHETVSVMCDIGKEDVYVSTVWNSEGEPEWMAILWKKRGDDFWQFRHRFRYDAGTDDPRDDEKNNYVGVIDGKSEDEIVGLVDLLCTKIPMDVIPKKYDIRAWGEEARDKFIELPFANILPLHGPKIKA